MKSNSSGLGFHISVLSYSKLKTLEGRGERKSKYVFFLQKMAFLPIDKNDDANKTKEKEGCAMNNT